MQVGPFLVENSVRLDEVKACVDSGRISEIVQKTDSVFLHIPAVLLDEYTERLVRNGNPLSRELIRPCFLAENGLSVENMDPYDGQMVRIYDSSEHFLAIYQFDRQREQWRAAKMFL